MAFLTVLFPYPLQGRRKIKLFMMLLYDAELAERICAEKEHSDTEFRTSPSIWESVMALC